MFFQEKLRISFIPNLGKGHVKKLSKSEKDASKIPILRMKTSNFKDILS